MKTIKLLLLLFTTLLLFSQCSSDGLNDLPPSVQISILNKAGAGDTLAFTLDYCNLSPTKNLKIYIDDIPVEILSYSPEKNLFKVIVPSGLLYGLVKIEYKGEVVGQRGGFHYINLSITGFAPKSGKGGDVIDLTGTEFQLYDSTAFFINTRRCKVLSLTNNTAQLVVPEGCGNGPIRIYLSKDGCNYEIKYSGPIFSYEFEEGQINIKEYYSYNDNSNYSVYSYLRNEKGQIISKIYNNGRSDEDYIYDQEGLLDTLICNFPDYMETYEREKDVVKVTRYHQDSSGYYLYNESEYYFLPNGRIDKILVSNFNQEIFEYFLDSSCEYEYRQDTIIKSYKDFDDGIKSNSKTYTEIYDIYNKVLLPVPGRLDVNQFNVIKNRWGTYDLVYNKYGELLEFNHIENCGEIQKKYKYKYE